MADIDDRTMPQRRADAADNLFRAGIGASGTPPTVPLVTMIVRMTLDQLTTGLGTMKDGTGCGDFETAQLDSGGAAQIDSGGTAQIDGIDAGISATTARILAADANIIPVVLGGAGEVLDLGRSRRLFSTVQRQALAEQYGGCAFPA